MFYIFRYTLPVYCLNHVRLFDNKVQKGIILQTAITAIETVFINNKKIISFGFYKPKALYISIFQMIVSFTVYHVYYYQISLVSNGS